MAKSAPTVFISAASIDLADWRDTLAKAFRAAQFSVRVQNDSLGPGDTVVREVLARNIRESDCVIHLAGLGYGSHATAPFSEHPDFQCSWTQFEYYYAHHLSELQKEPKKVIAFVCGPELSTFREPEQGEPSEQKLKESLQQRHRERVEKGEFGGTPWESRLERRASDGVADTVHALLKGVAGAVGMLGREHREECEKVSKNLNDLADSISTIEAEVGEVNEKLDRVLAVLERTVDPPPPANQSLRQIPPPRSGFVGRTDALKTFKVQIERAPTESALLALFSGMGGIGKTELARFVALKWRDRFPDAQILIDGGGTRSDAPPASAGMLMAKVIRSFHPESGRMPEDDEANMAAIYRETLMGKKVMILLDDASGADQAHPLIPPPGCALLVTSRRNFMLETCQPLLVGRLNIEESVELLRGYCADVPESEAQELAHLCAGMPLALRIAGARLALDVAEGRGKTLAVSHYLGELKKGRLATLDFDAPETGETSVSETLRLSLDSLPSEERRAWLRLFVFVDGFDIRAAEAVALFRPKPHFLERTKSFFISSRKVGFPQLVKKLVRLNLVEAIGLDRLRMHDLARDFALRELNSKKYSRELGSSNFAYAKHYHTLSNELEEQIQTGNGEIALKNFDADVKHYRKVVLIFLRLMTEAREKPNGQGSALCLWTLIQSLSPFISFRLDSEEQVTMFRAQLLAAGEFMRDPEAVIIATLNLAHSFVQAGDSSEGIDWILNAENLANGLDLTDLKQPIRLGKAQGFLQAGQYREAKKEFEKYHEICVSDENWSGQAESLIGLGMVSLRLDSPHEALNYFNKATDIMNEKVPQGEHAWHGVYEGKALSYSRLDDPARAVEYHQKSLAISRRYGDKSGESLVLGNLACSYFQLGNMEEGVDLSSQQLALASEMRNLGSELSAVLNLGLAAGEAGENENAMDHFASALKMARESQSKEGECRTLTAMGMTAQDCGKSEVAKNYYEEALTIARTLETPNIEYQVLGGLGGIYSELNEMERSSACWKRRLEIDRSRNDKENECEHLLLLAHHSGDAKEEIHLLKANLPLARELGKEEIEFATLTRLGELLNAIGDTGSGIEFINEALQLARRLENDSLTCTALGTMGKAYCGIGEYDSALRWFSDSYQVATETGNRSAEGYALYASAIAHRDLGHNDKALESAEAALKVYSSIEDPLTETVQLFIKMLRHPLSDGTEKR